MPNYYIYGGINMKKVLAIVLSVAMLLSVLSVNVFAANDGYLFKSVDYTTSIDDVNGTPLTQWYQGVMDGSNGGADWKAFYDACATEGAIIEVVTTPGTDNKNVTGISLQDGSWSHMIQHTDVISIETLSDGKTAVLFDGNAFATQADENGNDFDSNGAGNIGIETDQKDGSVILWELNVRSGNVASVTTSEGVTTEYPTVADAVEASASGDVVKLLFNAAENVTIPAGVTLELNGNTLTGDVTVSAGAGLTVAEGDTLDGNVTFDVADFDAFVADTKVTISGGEITGTFPSLDEIVAAYNSSVTGYEPAATLGLYLGWGSDQNVTVAAPGVYTLTWQGEEKGWDWLILKSGDGPDATAIPEGTVIRTTEILINGDKIAFTNDAEYIDYTVTADGKVENKYFFPNAFGGGGALGEKPTDLGNASSVSVTFIVDPDNYKTEDEIKAEVLGAVSITGGKFTIADIEDYLGDDYVVDGEGNVTPAPSAPIIVTNGDNTPIECDTMEDALANVQENGKITLLSNNVEVDKMVNLNKAGVTLDLGGNTLTASESFTYTDRTNLNDAHVVNISADNVKVCNGTIKSTVNNKHCLNVYQATGVVVEGLTLDHTNANAIKGGAPMVVGGSDVTVKYMLETITGANSWYGINVDTYAGLTSSLKFDANAQMIFSGTNPVGIYLESTRSAESGDTVNVTFGENVSITAPEGVDFTAVFVNRESTGANNITVTDPENAGLKDNGDGTFEVKPVGTSNKYKITGCVYLNEDYHALIVNGRFIAQPHVDNGTGFCTACKGAINK